MHLVDSLLVTLVGHHAFGGFYGGYLVPQAILHQTKFFNFIVIPSLGKDAKFRVIQGEFLLLLLLHVLSRTLPLDELHFPLDVLGRVTRQPKCLQEFERQRSANPSKSFLLLDPSLQQQQLPWAFVSQPPYWQHPHPLNRDDIVDTLHIILTVPSNEIFIVTLLIDVLGNE